MGNPDPDECDLLTSALRKADESLRRRVGLLPAGEPEPGLWRHCKGGLYCVVATCTVIEPGSSATSETLFAGQFSEEDPALYFRTVLRHGRGLVLDPEKAAAHLVASRMVVYADLRDREGSIWARPLAMFMGYVDDVPRFEKVGP